MLREMVSSSCSSAAPLHLKKMLLMLLMLLAAAASGSISGTGSGTPAFAGTTGEGGARGERVGPNRAEPAESYTVPDLHERLAHGRQLKIYLPKSAEKLEFIPADSPGKLYLYWEKGRSRTSRGRVSGTGSDRRWYIDKVTYEDQGTYVQRDYWNKEISTVKVAVTPRHNYLKCLAGESLHISLEGMDLADAQLVFSGEGANLTLVRDGARVSQDLPDYFDRVLTHTWDIEIRNVNFSDEGRYTLRDRRDRVVSVTRMDLTDHRESSGNPLMALLLLLGIPAGICCCCRKKIFKKKATTASTMQMSPDPAVHSPAGPPGPCPPYGGVGQPGAPPTVHPPAPTAGPGPWVGPPPSPGFNPAYPPQNPAYPPQNPAYPAAGPYMAPPAQPPQWNGPPAGAPAAPMGYSPAPVMYGSPPVEGEQSKTENPASPTEPLLSDKQQADAAPSNSAPGASHDAMQFQIDGGKGSTNFL